MDKQIRVPRFSYLFNISLSMSLQIYMEETARGCSQENLGRVQLNPGRTGLASKYGLKLVAGTFVKVPWSGKSTEQDLCRNSRCLGFPFPTGKG